MKKIVLLCCIAICFFACEKDEALKKEIAQNNQLDEDMDEEFERAYSMEKERVWDLIVNEEANEKYRLEPLFIQEINFGIPGGRNWFALLPHISGMIDDDWLNMHVYVIDDSQGITRSYYTRSTNPVLINRPDILGRIPGTRYDRIQSFVINDFDNDGYDEILSYILLPPGGNYNYFLIDKYDSEKDRMMNTVLKIEFNLMADDNNFMPIEYSEIGGRFGFRIYTVMDDGTSKWLFYAWDNETRRYEDIANIIPNRAAAVIDPLPPWTVVSDSTLDTFFARGIKYIDNRFIARGNDGKLAHSKDGKTWTAITDSTFGSFYVSAVGYGNGLFVAGGEKMAYSRDGITWTAVSDSTFSEPYIRDIEYGNGRFIAVGHSGKIAYSADGVTWTAVENTTFGNNDICSVIYANDRFIAVGDNGNIAYSRDGATWTAVPNTYRTFESFYVIYDIVYGNDRFVAVAGGGIIGYSRDGIIWTAVRDSTFNGSNVLSVAYGNNRFVATAVDGKMAYSADGITWVAVTDTPFGTSYTPEIAYGNNCFVAVNGGRGKIAWCDW